MNFFETVRNLSENIDPVERAARHTRDAHEFSAMGDHGQAALNHRVASIMHYSVLNHADYAHDSHEGKREYHAIMAKHHEDLQKHHETQRIE
jgi:hypothetical protein